MNTLPLFGDESWEDALEADLHAAGGAKKIGATLWPTLGPVEGGRKLRRIVNKEHKQKLDKSEEAIIIGLAARSGSRRLAEYYAKLARARIIPVTPEDEKQLVLEKYAALRPHIESLLHDYQAIERRDGPERGTGNVEPLHR